MSFKKIALLVLLLTFLSGTFTLDRLNLGFTFEIRHLLFLGFIFTALIELIQHNKKSMNRGLILKGLLIPLLLTVFLYILLLTISFFYTIDQAFAFGKLETTIFLFLLIISILFIVCRMDSHEFFSFISGFFVFVGIVYVIPVYLSVFFGADRGDIGLSGPNVTTRVLFFAVCSSIYWLFSTKKAIYFILTILFLLGIVLIGSRGGVVGTILTFFALFFIKKILMKRKFKIKGTFKYRYILFLTMGIGVFYMVYEPVKRVFLNRMIGTTFSSGTVYTSGRDIIYADTIKMIIEKPLFGHGIDSFQVYTGHVYPHNLLLEMLVEVGLLGAVFFSAFVLFSVIIIFKMKSSPLFILSGLPLYMIIVQMLSGEFYDFRYYFLWSVPILFYGGVEKLEIKLSKEDNPKSEPRI